MTSLTELPCGLQTYYMPHHRVTQSSSNLKKKRVVFDASAKDANGISLNDTLHVGPKLQKDMGIIQLRFRLYPFVFTCDVRQMYQQILISENHRYYQLIR